MPGSISQAIGRIADEIAEQFDGYHVIILAGNPDTGHFAVHASSLEINTPAEMIEAIEMVAEMIRAAERGGPRADDPPADDVDLDSCGGCGESCVIWRGGRKLYANDPCAW